MSAVILLILNKLKDWLISKYKWQIISFILGVVLTLIIMKGCNRGEILAEIGRDGVNSTVSIVTNFGKLPDHLLLTNLFNFTNWKQREKTNITFITNWTSLTDKMTVTDIMTMAQDYSYFWNEPFIFAQTNNKLQVSLYERSAGYTIKQWQSPHRFMIGLSYPWEISASYMLFNWSVFDTWTGGGYNLSNEVFQIGLSVGF